MYRNDVVSELHRIETGPFRKVGCVTRDRFPATRAAATVKPMPKLKDALAWPFMAPEDRLRLRHQRMDAEAAKRRGWALQMEDISVTLVTAVEGSVAGGDELRLAPAGHGGGVHVSFAGTALDRWFKMGSMEWDALRIRISGDYGTGVWYPETGGLRPGFDAAEILRAGHRPIGSGECLRRVAAIATVGLAGRHIQRILFLDAEARELAWLPAKYFAEDDIIRLAQAAGIAYRRYAFTFARYSSTQISPRGLCEVLFPRSARRVKVVSEDLDAETNWFSTT